jgi:hypothetical protein
MAMDQALKPEQRYRRCDPEQLRVDTTAELPDLTEIIGQTRALGAMRFGINMANSGHNIYALGPPCIGKDTLDEYARRQQQAHAILREGSLSITYQAYKPRICGSIGDWRWQSGWDWRS